MTEALLALIGHVRQNIDIDADRICITGINSGAAGAWKMVTDAPDHFSAIVPVVTVGPLTSPDNTDQIMKILPGRVFVKSMDSTAADHINHLIDTTKSDWKLSRLEPSDSVVADVPAYGDHQLLAWLADQRRANQPMSAITK